MSVERQDERILGDHLTGACVPWQVWQVIAGVAATLLEALPVVGILIDGVRRCHNWFLIKMIPGLRAS